MNDLEFCWDPESVTSEDGVGLKLVEPPHCSEPIFVLASVSGKDDKGREVILVYN